MTYTFKTVRDVVQSVRSFHQGLSLFLNELETQTDEDSRLATLLDYVARHERILQEMLTTRDDEHADGILDTWLQYTPDDTMKKLFAPLELDETMSADEIIARTLERDELLIELYKDLAEQSRTPPRVQEFFQTLATIEEKNRARHAWTNLDADE